MGRLLVVILILAAAGGGYYWYNGGLTTSASSPAADSGTPVVFPTAAAGEVSVELSQSDVSDQLSSTLVGRPLGSTPLGEATLSRVQAEFVPSQILVSGDATAGSTTVPFTSTATVAAQDGRAVVNVQSASVANVPLPDSVRQRIQSVVQQQVDSAIAARKIQVHSVTIGSGHMLLVGSHA
jgi:hypothetical protein